MSDPTPMNRAEFSAALDEAESTLSAAVAMAWAEYDDTRAALDAEHGDPAYDEPGHNTKAHLLDEAAKRRDRLVLAASNAYDVSRTAARERLAASSNS